MAELSINNSCRINYSICCLQVNTRLVLSLIDKINKWNKEKTTVESRQTPSHSTTYMGVVTRPVSLNSTSITTVTTTTVPIYTSHISIPSSTITTSTHTFPISSHTSPTSTYTCLISSYTLLHTAFAPTQTPHTSIINIHQPQPVIPLQ